MPESIVTFGEGAMYNELKKLARESVDDVFMRYFVWR